MRRSFHLHKRASSLLHYTWPSWLPQTTNRKFFALALVLAFGLIGYWLGPTDLALGRYLARIEITVDGQVLSVDYPFVLGDQGGQPFVATTTAGQYQFTVAGQDAYENQLGQRITYRIQVVDKHGAPADLTFDSATSIITGEHFHQILPPTEHSGEWLVFSMRIPYKAKLITALLFAVAVLWLTELVPLAAAALAIPVVIVIAGVADANTIFQPFFHPIVVLFLAGFLLAEGMHRTGADRFIALTILRRSSLEPAYLLLTMMSLSAFLSMWMSNTASVAILIPIVLAVLDRLPIDVGKTGFRRALILGVAYAATVGGIGSAIGTPANILALTFLNDYIGSNFTFTDWFYYGLPMTIIMVPIIWLYLLLTFRVKVRHVGPHLSHDAYQEELEKMNGLSKEQIILLLVFVVIMALWLTERWHHIPTSIVALAGVLLLFFTETIKKDDLNHVNWNVLLTFGGGLALGSMLVLTGVSDWIALQLIDLSVLPPLLVVLALAGLTLVIGAFISNTACAAMMIPLAIPMAQILHMDPVLLVAIVAIASSIDFAMVVGTPPTMLAYSTGHFQVKEIFSRGIILDLIGVLILSLGVIWIWRFLGVVAF